MNPVQAKDLVTAVCVPMGEEAWTIFGDSEAMQNIAECPVEVVHGLGTFARNIPTSVSLALRDFDNPTICRDLLMIGMEKFGEAQILHWLTDPKTTERWLTLSHQFNEKFIYSRDSESTTSKNFSHLKERSTMIFRSFEEISGRVDPVQEAA